jgi:hypothetical protein
MHPISFKRRASSGFYLGGVSVFARGIGERDAVFRQYMGISIGIEKGEFVLTQNRQ